MQAIVRPTRIDIEGAAGISEFSWEPLLDELQAIHMPGITPPGKRLAVSVSPRGRINVVIYRTGLSQEDIIRILAKYGIEAFPEGDMARGASN
jgi:hypothetical protein